MYNGLYSTAKTVECHKTWNASLLRDILEENVDSKYYLSEETAKKILIEDK
jgi:hypothetical protein